jgi:hypothetical protein
MVVSFYSFFSSGLVLVIILFINILAAFGLRKVSNFKYIFLIFPVWGSSNFDLSCFSKLFTL